MNVLWIAPSYPTAYEPVYGIFLKTQAEAMARLGVHVQVVAPVPWIPPLPGLVLRWNHYRLTPRAYSEKGVQVLRPRYFPLPLQNYWQWPYHAQLHAIRSLRLSHPDLIHAHFAFPQGLIALYFSERWKVPMILTLRGGDVNRYPQINSFARNKFRETLQKASAVLAVSQALSEKAFELSGVRPAVLRTGINLEPYANLPEKAKARTELGLRQDHFIVLFVGHLHEKKGVKELVAALGNVPDQDLMGVFVGDGPLFPFVKKSRNTMAAGKKTNETVQLYLAAADVLVLPSHSEGLPNVVVEAGAAGTPVIGSNVGGIPELLEKERGYLISPGSVTELAQVILQVRQNYESASERAKRLKEHIFEFYDVNKNARTLYALYGEISHGKSDVL